MVVQLDNGGVVMFWEKIVVFGVGVYISKVIIVIVCEVDGLWLNFVDGGVLWIDMVVFLVGICLQDVLVCGCVLQVGECGGIYIDGQCCIFDLDVLVIGECVLWDNKIYGLVVLGYQMVCIVVVIFVGEDVCFSGVDMSIKLKLLGVDVVLFGDVQGCMLGCQSY